MPSESHREESRPIRVLLVDDHWVMRDGLRLMLEGCGEFEVVGQAWDGRRRCGLLPCYPRTSS